VGRALDASRTAGVLSLDPFPSPESPIVEPGGQRLRGRPGGVCRRAHAV